MAIKYLYITYNKWKSIVQAKNYTIYHVNENTNNVRIITGNRNFVLLSHAVDTNYTDWDTNFSSSSTLKDSIDDAILDVIEDQDDSLELPIVISTETEVKNKEYDTRLTEWTSNITVTDSSWVNAYTLDVVDSIFYSSIFQLNTRNMYFRMQINGGQAMDLDLEELYEKYNLRSSGSGSYNNDSIVDWPLVCISNNSWRLKIKPSIIKSSIILQFKSKSNNRKIYRGMTWWGV